MSRFCPSCGQQARTDDRFCVRCGQEVNANAQPAAGVPFRAHEHPRRRSGSFVVRHLRGLMAMAVVAAIAVAVALSGSSRDTTPTPADAAPAADVAAEQAAQDTSAPGTAPAKPHHRKAEPKPKPVAVRGSNGKTYMCGTSALIDAEVKDAVVKRREKVLTGRRRAVRALVKRYPGGNAPSSVVDRYHYLLARANAQVTFTNKAIHAYNRTLENECEPK
jgi:hypothetical protein